MQATERPTGSAFETIDTFALWDEQYYTPLANRYYDQAIAHMLRELRVQPGDTVLDAGCGPGVHSIRVARAGFDVDGVDISPVALAEARRRAEAAGVSDRVHLREADLTRLDIADESYDRVFCWGVVIHIPDIEVAVKELARVVRPGGRLALYVTNQSSADYAFTGAVRRLRGRAPLALQHGRLGAGCWYESGEGRLWVWRVHVGALTEFLSQLGLQRVARRAGTLTELHCRMRSRLGRDVLQRLNNAWYGAGLPAGPSVTNLLVFEKRRTP